jgi:hypothetical protein
LQRDPHGQNYNQQDDLEIEGHAPVPEDNNNVEEDMFLDAEDYANFKQPLQIQM